jgi:glycosyltransferase involved in cell wall biosynthesis
MLLGNYPYPQDYRVRREATSLVEAGYRVAVVAPARRGQPLRELVDGVDVYRYPGVVNGTNVATYALEYAYTTLASLTLAGLASVRARTEVVHAHNPPDTFFVVGLPFKLLRRRFVYDHHDVAPELFLARFSDTRPGRSQSLVYRVLLLLERLSCRLADRVIATNESYRGLEVRRGGVPPERITIVRNGPGSDKLTLEESDPELRARAGCILGYIGVMGHADGVDYLIRAVHHLVHDLGRDDVYCVVIGEGDAVPDLQRLVVSLGLERHVEFPGRLSDIDVRRVLCTADICVDPDPSNVFNDLSTMQKVMDYMALGRPVVAFDLPEHRRTAGDAAVYVRPNDELALARAIAELMDDPERRKRLGELGRKRVEEELAWEHSRRNLLAMYERLLGPDGRAAADRGA